MGLDLCLAGSARSDPDQRPFQRQSNLLNCARCIRTASKGDDRLLDQLHLHPLLWWQVIFQPLSASQRITERGLRMHLNWVDAVLQRITGQHERCQVETEEGEPFAMCETR